MGLALEMQIRAAELKIQSLRKKRGKLAADDDHETFVLVNKEIEQAEAHLKQVNDAIADRDAEIERQIKVDRPRRRKEQHEWRIAALEEAAKRRADAQHALAEASNALSIATGRFLAASAQMEALIRDSGADEPTFSAHNTALLASSIVAAGLMPFAGSSGFFGGISCAAAMHHSPASLQGNIQGLIEALKRKEPE